MSTPSADGAASSPHPRSPFPASWFELVARAPRMRSPLPHRTASPSPAIPASLPPSLRLHWIDIGKGAGIMGVVYVHFTSHFLPMKFLMLFGMPFFFFISGFLHTPQPQLKRFAQKKFIRLIVPYISFILLLASVQLVHLLHHHEVTSARLFHGAVDLLWGGSRFTGIFSVLWFLSCLFLTQLSVNWLLVRFRLAVVLAVAAAGMLLSYVNSLYFPGFSLPLAAHIVAAAAPFFLAGYLCRRRSPGNAALVATGIAGFAVSLRLLALGLPVFYDMHSTLYGTPFLTPLLALCCICGCWQLCRLLNSLPLLGTLLRSIGTMSLGIMLLHKSIPLLPGYDHLRGTLHISGFWAALICSYVLSLLLNRFSFTRALFLGSEQDFLALVRPATPLQPSAEVVEAPAS